MNESGPDGLLAPGDRKRWRIFMEQHRRRRRMHARGLDYVPVRAMPRPDGRYDHVLVVDDEVVVHAEGCSAGTLAGLRERCEEVATARAEVDAGFRRFRGPRVSEVRDDEALPVYVAVVAGRIKGAPSPELALGRPQPRNAGTTGHRPTVVVIDTGLDAATVTGAGQPERQRTDGWLDRFELAGGDHVHLDPLDVVPPIGGLDLGAGHGTFVAGLIALVAPAARITMLRAFDSDGFATDEALADAIVRAGDMFPDGRGVLNLSCGVDTLDDREPACITAALATLPPEVVVVAAAGNVATGTPFWPAASNRVLAVAALGEDGRTPLSWSNHGDWVDFAARGEGLSGPFVAGRETQGTGRDDDPFDTEPDEFDGPDAFASWAGTSFATAQVSGLAAHLLSEQPTLSPDDIRSRLQDLGEATPQHGYALPVGTLLPGLEAV